MPLFARKGIIKRECPRKKYNSNRSGMYNIHQARSQNMNLAFGKKKSHNIFTFQQFKFTFWSPLYFPANFSSLHTHNIHTVFFCFVDCCRAKKKKRHITKNKQSWYLCYDLRTDVVEAIKTSHSNFHTFYTWKYIFIPFFFRINKFIHHTWHTAILSHILYCMWATRGVWEKVLLKIESFRFFDSMIPWKTTPLNCFWQFHKRNHYRVRM